LRIYRHHQVNEKGRGKNISVKKAARFSCKSVEKMPGRGNGKFAAHTSLEKMRLASSTFTGVYNIGRGGIPEPISIKKTSFRLRVKRDLWKSVARKKGFDGPRRYRLGGGGSIPSPSKRRPEEGKGDLTAGLSKKVVDCVPGGIRVIRVRGGGLRCQALRVIGSSK